MRYVFLLLLLTSSVFAQDIINPDTKVPADYTFAMHCGVLFNHTYVMEAYGADWFSFVDSVMDVPYLGDAFIARIKNEPTPTPVFGSFYGQDICVKEPDGNSYMLYVGAEVTGKTIEGIACARYVVEQQGFMPFVPFYQDDIYTKMVKEGPRVGERIWLYVNNRPTKFNFKFEGLGQMVEVDTLEIM